MRYVHDVGYRSAGSSPFLTARAKARAPHIMEYAASAGAAVLISPSGASVIECGTVDAIDVARIVRSVGVQHATDAHRSFRADAFCVHVAPVVDGFVLCIVSADAIAPAFTAERLRKAARVLALALMDGRSHGGSQGSAIAVAFVPSPRTRARAGRA